MGSLDACPDLADIPLWYNNYDTKEANYNDWISFGGWTYPAMKQYNPNVEVCGL